MGNLKVYLTISGIGALLSLGFTVYTLLDERIRFENVSYEPRVNGKTVFRCDLDGDGALESISIFQIASKRLTAVIHDYRNKKFGQYALTGGFAGRNIAYAPNTSGPLILFTNRNDSIYLNQLGIHSIIRSDFVEVMPPGHDGQEYSYEFGGVYKNYFFFSINAGYPITPRAVYRFDLNSGEVIKTSDPGSIVKCTGLFDLTGDGIPEVLTRAFAPENIHFDVTYTDSAAWLRIFDLELNHLFPPVPFRGIGTNIVAFPLETDTSNYLAFTHNYGGSKDLNTSISLVDGRGRFIWTKVNNSNLLLMPLNDQLYVYNHAGAWIGKLNSDLTDIDVVRQNTTISFKGVQSVDIDHDGYDEFIANSYEGLEIFSEGFTKSLQLKVRVEPYMFKFYPDKRAIIHTSEEIIRASFIRKNGFWQPWAMASLLLISIFFWFRTRHVKKVDATADDYLVITSSTEDIKLKTSDIFYIKADGNYSKIFLEEEGEISKIRGYPLVRMARILPANFYKFSRSGMVNLDKVKEIDKKGKEAASGRTKRRLIMKPPGHELEIILPKDQEAAFRSIWRQS